MFSSVKFDKHIAEEYVYKTVHEMLLVGQKLQNIMIVWNFEVMCDQYLTNIKSR